MNDRKPCGNYEALISYVYDECEPAERESLAVHLALCASCTEEIQSLRDTRAHLGAWSPPSLPLGFQITRAESEPAKVLRPAAWWRQPLPGWAQVAAAAVIFAAGMSVNMIRASVDAPVRVSQAAAPQRAAAVASPVADIAVTRAELLRLEARLRSVESADVQRASLALRTANGAIDANELSARVSSLDDRIAQSERQNLRMMVTLGTLARDLDAHRDATQRVNVMEEDVQDLRQAFRTAVAPSLAVRTSLTGGR